MTRDLFGPEISVVSPVAFSALSAAARCELGAGLTRLDLSAQVAPFEIAHSGQQTAPGIAIVAEGYLRLQYACESGRSQIATLFMPGDLIETELVMGDRLLLETVTNARLWVARPDKVASLLSHHPSLCRALAELRAIKLGQARWLSDALARLTAEERVVCFLVLATRWMPWQPITANSGVLTLTLPRPDVASLLASSVETISRVLARLDRKGLVDILGTQCFHLRDLNELCMLGRMAVDWQSVRFACPYRVPTGLPVGAFVPDGSTGLPKLAGRRGTEANEGQYTDVDPRKIMRALASHQ